ncbi:hypothetical protein ACSLO2_27605, partial [Escherichia coli]|uniref:hypothetical protein n=1 Tax=Escherichia coli TaxID=562 RepID=UPI003EDFCFA9
FFVQQRFLSVNVDIQCFEFSSYWQADVHYSPRRFQRDGTSGKVEVKLDSNWGKNGRVKIRQLDPLPLSVLAVIPRLTVGGF